MRWLFAVVVLCAAAAMGWWVGGGAESEKPEWWPLPEPTPTPVLVRADLAPPATVHALGRLQPRRVVAVAGPGRFATVVDRLLVDQGDRVHAGQLLAVLESAPVEQAEIELLEVDLAEAERELRRVQTLGGAGTEQAVDLAAARVERLQASRRLAAAELERSRVRAPLAGLVLEVHAHEGEKIGPHGIVEIADVAEMEGRAEVFEDEIGRIRAGQPVVLRSPALPSGEIRGRVARLGLRVQRQGVIDADPVAEVDARVIEVAIALDDPESAAMLTDLRVDCEIDVSSVEDE